MKDCACVDEDARLCFEKRYGGFTDVNSESMSKEKCDCPCHDEQDDDGEEE